MKLLNLRLKHATNSSSSHSFIILHERIADDAPSGGEYWWGQFTLSKEESKLDYLAVAIRTALEERGFPERIAEAAVQELLGVRPTTGSIDHQSLIDFPCEYGGEFLDLNFIDDFARFVKRPEVKILGGNDNGGTHPLVDGSEKRWPLHAYRAKVVCRKDTTFNFWTIFNQETGAKLRMSFENLETWNRSHIGVDKAETPELIDMSITDFCDIGCEFCYRDSTEMGKPANYFDVINAIEVFKKMKVFEIAIGGGEPTTHPQFVQILRQCRESGIVPNFTTRSLRWTKDSDKAKEICELCGSFAFSVSTEREIRKLSALCEQKIITKRPALHIVLGTVYKSDFAPLLDTAMALGFHVTLLGYKDVGRGPKFTMIPYPWWLDEVKKAVEKWDKYGISIDTPLAAEYEEDINSAGVSELVYHTEEGKWNAFIDVTNKKFGPSSYDISELRDYVSSTIWDLYTELLKMFKEF